MADTAPAPGPSFKKRTAKTTTRKRPATPPPEDQSASDLSSTDDEAGVRIKRQKRSGLTLASSTRREPQDLSKNAVYAADRTKIMNTTDDATRTSNWHESANAAAEAARATARRNREAQEDGDGAYKGSGAYGNHIQRDKEPTSGKTAGPQKVSGNVRTITVTDFAPDVCKDYKQTGFCGYGDGCKFLHAREDYKQGWQLDKEWEKVGKDKKPAATNAKGDGGEDDDSEEKMLERIPFKCIICKEDYKRPVVTKCGHYFCEKCAMTRYMREKKKQCANCGTDTGGTFNVARKLNELLEKKRKREAEKEDGGEVVES